MASVSATYRSEAASRRTRGSSVAAGTQRASRAMSSTTRSTRTSSQSAVRKTLEKVVPPNADLMEGPGLGGLTIRIGPSDKQAPVEGLVMLLHGAGGSAQCFEEWAEQLSQSMPHFAFLMPTAPDRNGMTSWFSRTRPTRPGLGPQSKLIKYGRVQAELLDLLDKERASLHLSIDQVVVLGYSAGSLMASWLALQLPQPCAGLVCLHGLCPDGRLPSPPPCPKAGRPPALLLAGDSDVQIPAAAVESGAKLLRERFAFSNVTLRIAENQDHGVGDEEFKTMELFIAFCLSSDSP